MKGSLSSRILPPRGNIADSLRGPNALLAPVGTPEAIVDKVSADLTKVLGETEIKNKLATLGAYVHPMAPPEVRAFVEEQQRTWRPVAGKVAKEMAHPAK